MATFSQQTKKSMLVVSAGYCMNKNCSNQATEFHHVIPNTEVNRKIFPLYIQSPFNCYPICNKCHMNKTLPEKPNAAAVATYERYLNDLNVSN